MLTVGSVLTTNPSQISLYQLLFKATLKVRLDSCLSLLLERTTLTAPKWMHILKNHSLSTGGAHSRVEASITSPTSASYLAKQLMALFHTQTLFSFHLYCSVLMASTWSTRPRSPTGLGILSQGLGLPDEYSLSHCGLSTTSRHKLGFTRRHYAPLTATDTTALYKLFFFFFWSRFRVIPCQINTWRIWTKLGSYKVPVDTFTHSQFQQYVWLQS